MVIDLGDHKTPAMLFFGAIIIQADPTTIPHLTCVSHSFCFAGHVRSCPHLAPIRACQKKAISNMTSTIHGFETWLSILIENPLKSDWWTEITTEMMSTKGSLIEIHTHIVIVLMPVDNITPRKRALVPQKAMFLSTEEKLSVGNVLANPWLKC